MSASPTELARAALRRIAEKRLSPTPEHFARLYYEAAGAPTPGESASPSLQGKAISNEVVEQLDELVDRIVAASGDLAIGIGQGSAQMEATLVELIADSPTADTRQLLGAIVATAKDMHVTLRASHAELVRTRMSLAEIKNELVESRKLLGQDALTGTENRRAMDAILVSEIARSRRASEPLSVAMIDLDHFKRINDTYGHATGDAALVHLTRLAKSMLRGHDAFIRYGGEEFVLVMPETGLQGAVHVTGRLQALLTRTPLVQSGMTIAMAFSAGVATLKDDDGEESLLRRADAALYEAKSEGRNRVTIKE